MNGIAQTPDCLPWFMLKKKEATEVQLKRNKFTGRGRGTSYIDTILYWPLL